MKKFLIAVATVGFVLAFGLNFHVNGKMTAQEIGPGPLSGNGSVAAQQPGPGPIDVSGTTQ